MFMAGFDPDDPRLPQNYDEITAFMELTWGDHPELKTVGDIRAAWDVKCEEMRS